MNTQRTPRRASPQLMAIARMAENLATLAPDALTHLQHLEHAIDGWPTRGDAVHVSGTGGDVTLNAVEAAAEARLRHSLDRADIQAGIRLLEVTCKDLLEACHHALRGATTVEGPRLCDPSGREGSLVPLDDGGWADWTCRDAAVKNGLCDRHYHKERRWRAANGLPARDEVRAS